MENHKNSSRSIPLDLLIISGSFMFIFMGAGAQQQFLAPYFSQSTDWSALQRGFIPATVYLTMASSRIPVLWLVDRIGERAAMILGGASYVAFPAVVYLTQTYWALILGAACWGVGATLMWVTSSTRVLDVSSSTRYGRASAVFIGSTFTGILMGTFILTSVASYYAEETMRNVFIVASALSLIGWIIMLTLKRGTVHRHRPNIKTFLTIAKSSDWRIVGFLLMLAAMGYGLMLVPLGECITQNLGVAGLILTAGHPAARFVISVAGGWLSDVIGRKRVIVSSFFIAGAGLAWTALAIDSPLALGVGIFSIGVLGGVAPTVGLAFVGDISTEQNRLMVHASLFMQNDFGVAMAMLLGQILQVQMGGFAPTFGIFSVLLLLCGVWSFFTFGKARRAVAVEAES